MDRATDSIVMQAVIQRTRHQARSQVINAAWCREKWKTYAFRDRHSKCFFCGSHAHHTGFLPSLGGIWLCKHKCAETYKAIVQELQGEKG